MSFGRQTDVGDGRTRRAGPSRASRRVASRLVASCASRHVSSRIVSSHRVASWRRVSSRRVASRGIASRRVASRRVRASIVIRRRTSSVPPALPLLPHEYHSRRSQHIGTLLNTSTSTGTFTSHEMECADWSLFIYLFKHQRQRAQATYMPA